jgi:type IV secretory pathway protease TraF
LGGDSIEVISSGAIINGNYFMWSELTDGAAIKTKRMAPLVKVPMNHLYLIGDNLDESRDSRDLGTFPVEVVIGRRYPNR